MKYLQFLRSKNSFKSSLLIVALISLCSSCTKEYLRWTLPAKSELNVDVTEISAIEIKFKGEIISDNVGNIEEVGFLITKGNDFSLADKFPLDINSSNVYVLSLSEFDFSTYYEVQFYIITEAGESKSNNKGFDTPNVLGSPSLVLNGYSDLSLDNVNVAATVTLEGDFPVVSRGFCWSTTPNPTINNSSSLNGSGVGSYNNIITNLDIATTYFIRAYATNQIATSYSNQIELSTKGIGDLNYGDFYQGGLFFYLLQPGDIGYVVGETHGFLAAPQDHGNYPWGCSGTNIITSDAIGSGINNNQLIANNCGENNIAAKVCNNLSLNGYNDWFLPSRAELQLMYQNLHLNGHGNFSVTPGANDYWSSSQFNNVSAWFRSFAANTQNTGSKTGTLRVRAIRRF